ncbi:MAG TPA: hypothetical protein VN931_01890 [Fibrobacteria bacterium]|nr:hypothetical protein [Fibrobacteria bacterium]
MNLNKIRDLPKVLWLGVLLVSLAPGAETFTWQNVKIGGGGGFVPDIVYSPTQRGLVYARTDMGGLYRRDSVSKTWTPLTDWIAPSNWDMLGVESFATDPVHPNICYYAAGTYTNSWDPGNGRIERSTDYGDSWTTAAQLTFKCGGNMPGRGMGERLDIDPNSDNVLYFAARSGNGLWKSTNSGQTWARVTSFPVTGDYVQDGTQDYTSDPVGIAWVAFDKSSSTAGTPCSRIFVGAAQKSGPTVFESDDAGSTWAAIAGQPLGPDTLHIMPHHGVIRDSVLYLPYCDKAGPYDGDYGEIWKYNFVAKVWTDITPHTHEKDEAWGTSTLQKETPYFGYGGFDVDPENPQVIMAASLNSWWPDAILFRSTNGGASWTKSFYWTSYPTAKFKYTLETTYPWLNWGVTASSWPSTVEPKLGWMISGLAIDPFDSDEMMYGTGATIYGTENLTDWGDTSKPLVDIKSVADGVEECAVLALAAPPVVGGTGSNVKLVSGVGDIGGFAHTDLQTPTQMFQTPLFTTTSSLDYAELAPVNMVRVGTSDIGIDPNSTNHIGTSSNAGLSWNMLYVLDTSYNSGSVAMSAKASSILWAAAGKVPQSGAVYALKPTNLPPNAMVASDRVDDSTFYASYDSAFYRGSGATYTANLSAYPAGTYHIKAVPGRQGQVWVPADTQGLWLTKDGGKTFSRETSAVQEADVVGFGMAAPGQSYPAVYITGKVSGVEGVFLSKDSGSTWTRINDDAHQYAQINSAITGDMRQYGIVFVGTNGRGIVYGQVSSGGSAIKTAQTPPKSTLSRNGRILTASGTNILRLFDLRGVLLRGGGSDGRSASVDLTGLGAGVYLARWGRNAQAVAVGD